MSLVTNCYKINKNLADKLIKTAEKCLKGLSSSSGKHLKSKRRVFWGLLSGCVLVPARPFIAVCDSKSSSHTRIVGINSIEKLHQEAKFDWKKFYTIVRHEVWYILFAVVVSF